MWGTCGVHLGGELEPDAGRVVHVGVHVGRGRGRRRRVRHGLRLEGAVRTRDLVVSTQPLLQNQTRAFQGQVRAVTSSHVGGQMSFSASIVHMLTRMCNVCG